MTNTTTRTEHGIDEQPLLLDTLLQVANALARPLPLQENVAAALAPVVAALELDRGVLYAPKANGLLQMLGQAGPHIANQPASLNLFPGAISIQAFDQHEAIVENNHMPGQRSGRQAHEANLHSLAAFPVDHNGEQLGVLHFGSTSGEFFNESRLAFSSAVANALGTLLYNAKLRDAMERQLRLSADRSEFIKMATHELLNPITVISGYTELMLKMESFAAQDRKWLTHVKAESNRLSKIVKDLSTLEWMRHGAERTHSDTFSLSHLLGNVSATVREDWPACYLRLTVNGDVDIVSDERRLRHVVCVAIDNAFRHAGVTSAEIVASVDPIRGRCTISVIDHGVGFPDGYTVDDISIFARPDYDYSSNVRGLGLGLFIVKSFLESCGGALSIDSSEQGATVTMELPTAIADRAHTQAPIASRSLALGTSVRRYAGLSKGN